MYDIQIPASMYELEHEELMVINGGTFGWAVLVAAAKFVYDVCQDLGREFYHLIKGDDSA